MTAVNNVTRLLDSRGVPYTPHVLPPEKLGAVEAAAAMGVPAELVFKTIVVTRERPGKPLLALIPGTGVLDLKALALALGVKKVSLPTEREAETLTGLRAGGISPLALINRGFQVVIDESARAHERIYVSGGQRGLSIELPVVALAELVRASFAAIAGPAIASARD
jgi:Cys-tRNA(Pro)/Cys-tRNA(Cys) deacylase